MKKIYVLLLAVLGLATGSIAQPTGDGNSGINETYAIFSINGGANAYYDMFATTGNPDLQGTNFGNFTIGSNTLVLKGGQNKVYKCGSGDITANTLFYRIYKTGTAPGSFVTLNEPFGTGAGNGCGGQDQTWEETAGTVNLMLGRAPGNYTIDVYSTADNNNPGTWTANNGGAFYKATFTILADPANPVSVNSTGGTAFANYPTLAAAFTAINAGTHTGTITTTIGANTTEPVGGAILNASGAGSASYTTITVNPFGNVTVSAAVTAGLPLVDLNGADNVTIDGLNTGGNSLTLSNTTVSTTAGTSTIRFIADASTNTIRNCSILGSSTSTIGTLAGTVLFSTGTTTGNDNNAVNNCNIGPAGANLPSKAIMANGTSSSIENDNVQINGNNIFDHFLPGSSNTGINILTGNEGWTISSNRFYQTATRTFSSTALRFSAITLNNSTGSFTVSGNIIGFASAAGTGTMTITGSSNEFRGIDAASVNTAAVTNIQNNTITAINQTSSRGSTTTSSSCFIAIAMGTTDGLINASGNTIGSLNGSSTIVINATSTTASTAPVIGLYNFSFFSTTLSNNNIGSITIQSTGTTVGFRGLLVNTTTAQSATITNNTIASITDLQVGSYAMYGIQTALPNATITGNTIRNFVGNSNGSALIVSAGILCSGSTGNNTISQNTIHSLGNASGAVSNSIYGMSLSLPVATNLVERNFIHSFSLTTTLTGSQLWGIAAGATGTTTYQNNMIRLGFDSLGNSVTLPTSIIGIRDGAGATNQFYHNTIYIGGAGVLATPTPSNTYCFFSDVVTVTRNFQDNIFWNARGNAVGGGTAHLAIRVGGTTANPAGLTSNYNILHFSGTDGATGVFNAVVVPTLTAWRTATGQDINSIAADPQLIAPNANAIGVNLHIHPTNPTPIEAAGLAIGTVTNDFDGQTRSGFTPTDIGADAGNFVSADLSAPAISYTALLGSCTSGDRVLTATIVDASGVPTTGTLQPRIYYRKNAGAYFSSQGVLASGSGTNGTWNFTIVAADMGGLAISDVVSYFVIAQDIAVPINIASNPGTGLVATDVNTVTNPPTTPNSYSILPNLAPGYYSVGAGTLGGEAGHFATITAAFAAYNAACLSGPVRFLLTDATYTTVSDTIKVNPAASSTNRLTIAPATGVTAAINGNSSGCVIVLAGADYVTIDGSNNGTNSKDLTITNANAGTSSAVVCLTSAGVNLGATNNVVKNTNLVGTTVTATNGTLFGIFSGSTTISNSSSGADNDNNTIQNNNITKVSCGIYSSGESAANKNGGTIITQNVMNAPSPNNLNQGGIFVRFENGAQITQNDISVLRHDGTTGQTGTAFGIALGVIPSNTVTTFTGSDVTGSVVNRNKINGITQLSSTGYSSFGIVINSVTSGTTLLSNNMVSGVIAPSTASDFSAGIMAGGGTGSTTNIYHNSVAMTGSRGAGTGYPSYALAVNSGDPVVDIRNNILQNTQTGGTGKSYTIANASSTFANMTSNYNDLDATGASSFVGQTGGLGTAGADQLTLSNWQTATGKDAASITVVPAFVSSTDLHLTPSASCVTTGKGVNIPSVANDFDNNSRNTLPFIGAHEAYEPATAATTIAGTVAAGATVNTTRTYNINGATDYLLNCNIISTITPGTVTGLVTAGVRVDTGATKMGTTRLYAARFYDVLPATNPATATGTVKLYYLQSEFDNFNLKALDSNYYPLPDAGNSFALDSLRILIYHGAPSGGYFPGNYSGAIEELSIANGGVSVVWNPTANGGTGWWEITFPANGFSGYFISAKARTPLPIKVEYFRGTKQNSSHVLDWKVVPVNTTRGTITLERSSDSRNFTGIYSITATAVQMQQAFTYTSTNPFNGINYYRLKLVDDNGVVTYSGIVALTNAGKGLEFVSITPNPVTDGKFKMNIASAEKVKMEIIITDVTGRIMVKQTSTLIAGFNAIDMNVSGLANGVYQIFGNTADGKTKVLQFVKQ